MKANNDFYREYSNQYSIRVVQKLAQYLCDRFPQNYAGLLLELCKMFCNQNYDTKYEIDKDIVTLPFILKLEGNGK